MATSQTSMGRKEWEGGPAEGCVGPTAVVFRNSHSTRDLYDPGRPEGRPLLQAYSGSLVLLAPAGFHLLFCSQISPQVFQSLCFTDLKPVQHPDFLMFRVLDQQSRRIRWVSSDIQNELEAVRGQIFTGGSNTPIGSISSVSMHSLGASASRVTETTSLKASASSSRPWSASSAHSSSSISPLTVPRRGQKAQSQLSPFS